MTHHFNHKFASGDAIVLTADMDAYPPTLKARPVKVAEANAREYGVWLHEVIVPELVRLANEAQMGFPNRGVQEIAKRRIA